MPSRSKQVLHKPRANLPHAACTTRSAASECADNAETLITQVYRAILERRPAQIIAPLKGILAKPDPELRFWSGRAYQVAACDHAAAQER